MFLVACIYKFMIVSLLVNLYIKKKKSVLFIPHLPPASKMKNGQKGKGSKVALKIAI